VLTPETKQSLEELCTEVDRQAHAQIAVVTVQKMEADPAPSGKAGGARADDALPAPTVEEFATALEDKWKVGAKGTDRGVLVIVSLDPRKYRIEVGYGLEGTLPDGKVGDIGREMQPYLHTNDYNQAIALGVREISQVIATDAGVTLAGLEGNGAPVRERYYSQPQAQMQVNPIAALVFGVILLLVVGTLIRTGHIGRRIWRRRGRGRRRVWRVWRRRLWRRRREREFLGRLLIVGCWLLVESYEVRATGQEGTGNGELTYKVERQNGKAREYE
jgi:uncharacterized membrane protein YgcG